MSNVKSKREECSGKCKSTIGCTHYTWTDNNNGTCLMKKGTISQTDAVKASDNVVCGILSSLKGYNFDLKSFG